MGVRSTESLVCFSRSFEVSALDAPQPPGTYRVLVDEEQLEGLSFVAYRRVATMLCIPAIEASSSLRQVVLVDPVELAAAIGADVGATSKLERSKEVQL